MVTNFKASFFPRIPFDLSKLERLKFSHPFYCYLNSWNSKWVYQISQLNELKNLKHLELPNVETKTRITLSLPNLKRFHVGSGSITLDTPKLEILSRSDYLSDLEILHPKSIKQLYVRYCESDGVREELENVEIFKTTHFSMNIADFFACLPKLRSFEILDPEYCYEGEEMYDSNEELSYEETCALMNGMLKMKRRLKRDDLELYFMGNRLDDNRKFEKYDFDCICHDAFGIDKYEAYDMSEDRGCETDEESSELSNSEIESSETSESEDEAADQ